MGLVGRRQFLVLAAALLLASPNVDAQKVDGVRRVAYLSVGGDHAKRKQPSPYHQAFLRGLAERGFVVGKNVIVEYRFAEGKQERLPTLVAELLERKVEVIFGWANAASQAAKATKTVPIVFTGITDPVADGLVQSLAHPGGNVTGISNQGLKMGTKRLELLKMAVPAAQQIAYLANLKGPLYEGQRQDLKVAAPSLGVQIHFFETQKPSDLAGAFAAMKGAGVDGLVLQEASLFNVRSVSQQIADLALEGRLPAMCQHALFVRAGCLMSYGPDFVDIWRRAGVYVAKILDGATPAELPVEQPIKFELSINMKTANAIGITIPPSIMLRADRVIE